MSAQGSRLGVAAAGDPPWPAPPPAPEAASPPPGPPPAEAPPVWPPAAQAVTAGLLVLLLGLLSWHVYAGSRLATRPTELQPAPERLDLNRADRADLVQLPG